MCATYHERYERFPASRCLDKYFIERVETIFHEMFLDGHDASANTHQFFINDNVVSRAIDLVSGLLQQLKILMDDTNAPIWNGSQVRPVVVLPVSHEQSAEELEDRTEKKKRKKKKVVQGM